MTSLFNENTRMALQGIKGNLTRSLLTMTGIIIGVASVILTVSLGEGIRRQVSTTNQSDNPRLISVRPGKLATRDKKGNITEFNPLAAFGANSLTEHDYESLRNQKNIKSVVPLSTVSGLPSNFDKKTYKDATIIATTPEMLSLIEHEVAYGSFFNDESGKGSIAIGKRVAEQLYGENVPLGKLISIRGQDFIVGAVLDEFQTNPLSSVADLNKAVFVHYNVAKSLANSAPNIFQILVLPADEASPIKVSEAARKLLISNHGGQEDFTILRGEEVAKLAKQTVDTGTAFVAGIAAISLLVGGIGIMNIMFVSVTERTREIGVRKSLGATNRQIYSQYLVEATVISVVGGIIGVIVALLGNIIFRLVTDLEPIITLDIILISVGVSAAVGIVFGTIPAVKAARKDPIESLRYE